MKVTAQAQRSGDWWAITVPEVAGGIHTQAKRLDQVADTAAGAVADVLEIPVEDVEVDVQPILPAEVRELVAKAKAKAGEAATAQYVASLTMRDAVARLRTEEHLTTRDAAALLGVTQQRISQLSNS